MKLLLTFFLLITVAFSNVNKEIELEIIETNDFLQIQKNFLDSYKVKKDFDTSKRIANELNNLNFAMKPLIAPIKPFDNQKIHYAYPLKIFLPKEATVTSATLSNSNLTPSVSYNVITVGVDRDFQSGILDIVYIVGSNIRDAKYISVKLDNYLYSKDIDVFKNKLYTQIQYYIPKQISNQEILSALKPFEYNLPYTKIKYMGNEYNIHLVSIVKDGKVLKEYKDSKYINSALFYNNISYNYYIN
jgi:hypothetical protein